MDTQGVSRDEAMASGLVPLTSRVAAVPEFTNEHCAFLAEPDDINEIIDGIVHLYENPNDFKLMSMAASHMVKSKSCHLEVIGKELSFVYI